MKNFFKVTPITVFLLGVLVILNFTKIELKADTAPARPPLSGAGGGAITAKKPIIHFPEPVFDFGSVYQGEDVTHAFKFQNIGDDTLKLSQVRASCGCSKAEASTKEIAPGEFGQIEVTFRTAGYTEEQTKTIEVYSNDPLNPNVELTLKGKIKLEVEIKPTTLMFETVSKHASVTKQFEIIQRSEHELLIDKVTTTQKYLRIDSIEKKESKGKNIYVVSVTLNKNVPLGYLSDVIEISTNLERQKRILMPTQVKVLGDINLSAERVLFRMPAGAKRVFHIILSTRGDNFEVLRVDNNIKYLSVEVSTLEKFRKYRIDFSVAPEALPGAIRGDVKVYTNCPGETELEIPVFGWVVEKAIEIGYFFERGCLKCERVNNELQSLKTEFPAIILKEYDIESRENMELNETLCEIYGVPEEKRLIAPSIFIGKDFLVGESITKETLVELINKYQGGASLPFKEATKTEGVAEGSIADRFRSFGVFAIIGAGLVDGINPCAFATIIFFISYLAILKRKGRELITVGIVFTFAVFITYFLIGIGLFEFLKYISFLKTFTKFIYAIVGVLTLMLGVFSLIDYFKCRKGKAKEMTLQLPAFLKKRIHSTIKEQAGLTRYVLAAFITGFIVSILELTCTGQVYLPTIVYATGISNLRVNAYTYLLLYNFMFILPLIVIFILAYLGTTAIHLSDILRKKMALIKLLTSIFFFIFTAFLIMMLIVPI